MHVKSNLYKSLGLLLAVMLLFAALPAGEVKAATPVYVDDNFDSSTPGWGTTHFASIQDGIDAVDPGGTVNVADGVYTAVDRALAIIDKPLTLTGESQAGTILDGGTYGAGSDTTGLGNAWTRAIVVQANNVTIENMTIRNYQGDQVSVRGFAIAARADAAWGVAADSIDYLTVQNILFQDTYIGIRAQSLDYALIQNNTYDLVSGLADYFLYIPTSTDLIIRGNDSEGGCYWVTGATNAMIGGPLSADGNTVVDAVYNGIWLGQQFAAGTSSSGTIQNNTVNGAEEGGIVVWNFAGETADIQILDNTVSGANPGWDSHAGISVFQGIYDNLVISGNISNANEAGSPGLKLYYNTIVNADISDNTFINNSGEGILLSDVTRSGDISIDNNTISGNAGAEIKMELGTATTLDAYPNWFGASTGPAAGEIVGNVKVNPWCYTADCTQLYLAAGGSIQDAIDVIAEMPTPSTLTTYTIYVAEGTYNETVGIIQEENKNIVLQPELIGGVYGNVTLTDQIRIDGNGRSAGTESVTIQGFTFDLTAAGGQDAITSYDVAPAQTYVYSHNVYVKDSTFIGDAALGDVAVRAQATGGHYNYVFDNLTVTSMHSLAQMTSVSLVTVKNSTVSGGKSGVNLSGSPALIDGLTYTGTAYGVRTNGDLTIKNSSLTSSGDSDYGTPPFEDPDTALVLRHDTEKTITIENSMITNSNIGDFAISNTTDSPAEKVTLVVTDGDTGGGSFDLSLLGGFTPIRLIHTVGDTMTINFFTTIQAAVDEAVAGDIVDVGAGTYDENLTIGKSLSLIGAGPTSTFLTAPDSPVILVTANDVTIKDLGITDATQVPEAIRVDGATANLTIDNVEFTKLGAGVGANAYGINFLNPFSGLTVTGSDFIGVNPGDYTRVIGIFTGNNVDISDFSITGSTFEQVFVGIYFRGNVDGLDVISNTFGPMDINDCKAAAAGIYMGDDPTNTFIDDVNVSSNTFTEYCRGFYMLEYGDDGGSINEMTISNNTFNDSIYSSGIRIIADWYYDVSEAVTLTGPVNISGNTFTQSDPISGGAGVAMIDIRLTAPDSTNPLNITNNDITFSGTFTESTYGILVRGPITDLNITGNDLLGGGSGGTSTIDIPPTSGIIIGSDADYWGPISASAIVDVLNNTISGFENGISIYDFLAASYGNLPTGIDLDVNENIITNNTVGIKSGTGETTDATLNFWGSACGPSSSDVVGDVIYAPWYTDAAMTVTGSGELGDFIFPTNSTTDSMNAIIACAAPGSTLTFGDPAFAYPGGLMVGADKTALTFELNGATVGYGSSAFEVYGDDITINGPGTLDGTGDPDGSPGILVADGADNFILDGVYVANWEDGVQVQGAHTDSFKIVSSWLHDNANAGLLFDADVTLGGVITIEGNLFKENVGPGIKNLSTVTTIPADYNSWGHIDGPTAGDGVSGLVTTDPFTYSEVFVDMDPDTLATSFDLNEQSEFDVAVKVDAVNLYAVSYKLTYDPTMLEFVSSAQGTEFDPSDNTYCEIDTDTPGVISVYCIKLPGLELNEVTSVGATISTITFKATGSGLTDNGPWTTYLDLSVDESDLSSGAVGGVKVFVNNGGFGEPSDTSIHEITDTNDGEVIITGLANFTGYIDLQGRANDSGATLTVYDQLTINGATALANATSASSGKYTTEYIGTNQLTIGSTYYLLVDAYLFLPTTQLAVNITNPALPTDYRDNALLDIRSLTSLELLELLGGDASNNNVIDIADLSCIGGAYNQTADTCSDDGWDDVNGDGLVDIYDLVLAGGNYEKVYSNWPQ